MPTSQLPAPPQSAPRTGVFHRFGKLEDLTPKFLRDNYILGLTFVDKDGNPYPDTWYQQKLDTAISQFELRTQLVLTPFNIERETHDYYIRDYEQYAFLQLYNYPVIVNNNTPVVSAVYPTGQVITTFPREWVRVDAMHGQIQLIPTQGSLAQVILGQGGSYLPIIYQGLGYLPQLFEVNYTAGFEVGKVPQIILDSIAKLATIELLSVVGDTVRPAGVTNASLSVDGLSESRGFQNSNEFAPIFSGRISQYRKELYGDPRLGTKGALTEIKDFYRGINMWVVA